MLNNYILDSTLRIDNQLISQSELDRVTTVINGKKYPLYDVVDGGFIFPRGKGISYLKRHNYNYTDNRSDGRPISQYSNLVPRYNQAEIISNFCRQLSQYDGGILVSGCGTGKTIMGAEIVAKIGRTAVVCVHKEFIAEQWVRAFKMINPNWKVGLCREDQCDTGEEYDIVICFVQSLLSRNYPEEFYSSFGVLLGDEVHRYGAEKWKKVFERFPSRIRVGLTATPKRLDGFWPLIEANIGPILVRNSGSYLVPRIFGVDINTVALPHEYGVPWASPFVQNAKILKILENNYGRNKYLVKWVIDAYRKGRKIMFASAKRGHLSHIYSMAASFIPKVDMSFYVGGMKGEDRVAAEDASVIFTSYQMTAEGLDIPDLDVLIMGLPRTSIEQAIGRTLREFEGKGRPVVIDPIDYKIPNLYRSWLNRKKQYDLLHYEVIK